MRNVDEKKQFISDVSGTYGRETTEEIYDLCTAEPYSFLYYDALKMNFIVDLSLRWLLLQSLQLLKMQGKLPNHKHSKSNLFTKVGDAAAALPLLERARTQTDAATDVAIAIDYAEALAAVGRLEEALAAIELSGTAGAAGTRKNRIKHPSEKH